MIENYKIITTNEELDELIANCKKTGYASVDFETNALPIQDDLFYPTILGVSYQPGFSYIIPLNHFDSPWKKNQRWLKYLRKFGTEVIENKNIIKVGQNVKFEYQIFRRYGIIMQGRLFDTMLAKYLLDEEKPMGLKPMVARFLPKYAGYEEDYDGSKLPWDKKPLRGLSQYCAIDCSTTLQLMIFYEAKLMEHGLYNLFRNMLMMGVRVLGDSEYNGIRVDEPYLDSLHTKYEDLIAEMDRKLRNVRELKRYEKWLVKSRIKKLIIKVEGEIEKIEGEIEELEEEMNTYYAAGNGDLRRKIEVKINSKRRQIKSRQDKIDRYLAGQLTTKSELKLLEPPNFNSPPQMAELFFTSPKGFNFEVVKYTTDKAKRETDNPSTDEEVLTTLAKIDKTGFCKMLLEYRGLGKLYSTYIKGIKEKVVNGKVHGRFLLEGTVTGRLSSQGPNLQNIPRDTTSSDIKKMFIPPEGRLLLQLDYSQAELRVMATMANETTMLRWFREGQDIHLTTALEIEHQEHRYQEVAKLLKEDDPNNPETTKWKIKRKSAKTVNFGIIYGQGVNKLAAELGISEEEAKRYLNQYFNRFPKVKKFINKQHKFAKKNAYVRNLFGRKRRLWDVDSSEKWLVAQALRQCTDELTEALSKEGWKKYNQLREGEEILTKNPLTGVLEWQPIQKLNIYPDFKGDLYHFKNKSFDALVTSEHKWLANVTTKRNTNNFYTTKELYEGKLRLIHRQGEYIGPKESPYSDELINLIGWILTDGSLRYYDLPGKPRHGKPWKVTLTQSYTANPGKVKLINELLDRLGYNYHKKDKGGSYNWVFNNDLANKLHNIIPNKRLTMPFLLSLPKHQLEILYNSMSLGDGHRGGNAIITGEREQADMIQVLNILLGRTSNINIRDRVGRKCYSDKISNKKGYVEIKNKSYSVTSGRRKYFHTKSTRGESHITKLENQEQLVWCPTVENQTWVARRNGKQYITGNSVNAPIQGAASDFTLFSSILIWEKSLRGEIPLDLPQGFTVHDSLGFWPKPEDIHDLVPKLRAICENPETMEWFGFQIDDVKMAVDFEVSHSSWGELRAYDPTFDYTTLFK